METYPKTSSQRTDQKKLHTIIYNSIETIEKYKKDDFKTSIKELSSLEDRLKKGTFHLAVLGQFKRGKSTLLNALLENEILPTGVVPLTAIPTFIRNGIHYKIKISFNDEKIKKFEPDSPNEMHEILTKYVTEEKNPKNKLGVNEVEIFLPENEILKEGLVLIDTPGIGSTHRHNTEATLNFLPQCDAALFVLSPDPPITEVELEFLKEVTPKLNKFVFVLNKKDYLDKDELNEILSFLKTTLGKYFKDELKIFPLSAKWGLKGKLEKKKEKVEKSGIIDLEEYLMGTLIAEKNKILYLAIKDKVKNVLDKILMYINLELKSLQMPVEILEEKLNLFKSKLKDIEYQKVVIKDVLEGDRKRMHKTLEERAKVVDGEARKYLLSYLKEKIAEMEHNINEEEIEKKIAEIIPVFFEKKIGEETTFFKDSMKEILSIHQKKVNEIIESVRKNAAEIFEVPYVSIEEEKEFKITKEPYWVSHKWKSTFSPISPGTIDKMLPNRIRKQRILKRMTNKINELVIYNVENIRWSIYQSIDQNFRIFTNTLEEKIDSSISATKGAIEKSLEMVRNHSEKQREVLEKLKGLNEKIEGLKREIE